ncbi:MAG: glutamate-1-semialdehyde 2,1-aminomutase, partial [Verrucomicrobiales bacterium]
TALGKVIGGGLPVGAFGGRADIMDMLAPDGPVYQAGTLSGNPLAMAAGICQLKQLEKANGWMQLEEKGKMLEDGVRGALAEVGKNYTFHRAGSMFCLFFSEEPVTDLTSAQKADTTAFRKFFTYCLDNGVYLAPSPYETGFISMAHGPGEIEVTTEVMVGALKSL